ncbi:MAG: acetyltransferase [Promethearchaeia archaeon]
MSLDKNINNEEIVLIGDSALAEIAYEYFTYDSPFKVVAFSVEKDFITKEKLFNLPIIPLEELENNYPPQKYKVFIAISYLKRNAVRIRLYNELKKRGYSFVSYISSKAFVWRNVEIGENCFIFEDNTIQPFVKIGNNVILWSGNHIGHHSIIKDHCFISSHVVISGYCEIGENCFFGVNSTIGNNIKIADNTVIGAGALILRDTEKNSLYKGIKSKPEKYNKGVKKFFNLNDKEC